MKCSGIPHENEPDYRPNRVKQATFTAQSIEDERLLAMLVDFIGYGGEIAIDTGVWDYYAKVEKSS